jgi:hypothetical protein
MITMTKPSITAITATTITLRDERKCVMGHLLLPMQEL